MSAKFFGQFKLVVLLLQKKTLLYSNLPKDIVPFVDCAWISCWEWNRALYVVWNMVHLHQSLFGIGTVHFRAKYAPCCSPCWTILVQISTSNLIVPNHVQKIDRTLFLECFCRCYATCCHIWHLFVKLQVVQSEKVQKLIKPLATQICCQRHNIRLSFCLRRKCSMKQTHVYTPAEKKISFSESCKEALVFSCAKDKLVIVSRPSITFFRMTTTPNGLSWELLRSVRT